jgi:hypothetical protein
MKDISDCGYLALSVSQAIHLFHLQCMDYSLHVLLNSIYEDFDKFADDLLENLQGSRNLQIKSDLSEYPTNAPKDVNELMMFLDQFGNLMDSFGEKDPGVLNVINSFEEKLNKYVSLLARFKDPKIEMGMFKEELGNTKFNPDNYRAPNSEIQPDKED